MNFTTGMDANHHPCTSVLIFIIVINIYNNHNDNDHISGFRSQLARNRTTIETTYQIESKLFFGDGKKTGEKAHGAEKRARKL